jgi:cytochrome c oxidase assembly factor CtaG
MVAPVLALVVAAPVNLALNYFLGESAHRQSLIYPESRGT